MTIALRFLDPMIAPRPSLPKCLEESTVTAAMGESLSPAGPILTMLFFPFL
jgi:hypothetical protein